MAPAGRKKDLLGVLIRQSEARGRSLLLDTEPAISQIEIWIIQDDAAVLVGVVTPRSLYSPVVV